VSEENESVCVACEGKVLLAGDDMLILAMVKECKRRGFLKPVQGRSYNEPSKHGGSVYPSLVGLWDALYCVPKPSGVG